MKVDAFSVNASTGKKERISALHDKPWDFGQDTGIASNAGVPPAVGFRDRAGDGISPVVLSHHHRKCGFAYSS
jgi:hypothetical protein